MDGLKDARKRRRLFPMSSSLFMKSIQQRKRKEKEENNLKK